ncbi:hypothetical protein VKT23_002810 [Stygiomarasmius scandens]|uniref:DUF6534 domain-containing protein n=1 Tax=Marasmiellus scandens TaxID=2682957 RepID=A0ABR1JY37_9AGAR
MMLVLTQSRDKSLTSRLNAVIDSLILYSFENGAITTVATIVSMICWLGMDNLVFLGLHFAISKLYANSVLAVFNYRVRLRRVHEPTPSRSLVDLDVIVLADAAFTSRPGERPISERISPMVVPITTVGMAGGGMPELPSPTKSSLPLMVSAPRKRSVSH